MRLNESNSSLHENVVNEVSTTQPSRPSYNNNKLPYDQDLFETDPKILTCVETRLIEEFDNLDQLVVFEPCAGNGKISNFFKGKVNKVIERDIKTLPEKHDFIKDPDPEESFDLVITNPPFSIKLEILQKVLSYSDDIRIVLLLPLAILSSVNIGGLLKNKKYHFDVLSPRPLFLKDGKEIDTASCAWFYFNFTTIKSNCTFNIIQNGKIPDLDEDSVEEIAEQVEIKTSVKKGYLGFFTK